MREVHPGWSVHGNADTELVKRADNETEFQICAGTLDRLPVVQIEVSVAGSEIFGLGVIYERTGHTFAVIALHRVVEVHDSDADTPVNNVGDVAGEIDVVFIEISALALFDLRIAVGSVLE